MRIDPSRLSRLLLALGQKPEATRSDATGSASQAVAAGRTGRAPGHDIRILRKDIRSRLQALAPDTEDYDATAASITLQEILRWEFGPEILEHCDFHRVAGAIAETMLGDEKMAASLRKLARDLSQ